MKAKGESWFSND